jgi:hypothetical protein
VAAATGGAAGRGFAESAWSTKTGEAATSGCNTYVPKPSYQLDTGCTGRSYADISADADPDTGIAVYDTGSGGWLRLGGTSLSTPLIAAYHAIVGITNPNPSWAYTNSALLNDPAGGNVGTCAAAIAYICTAGVGYDGPTGIGSISGAVAQGAPGIGWPTFTRSGSSANTYVQSTSTTGVILKGGIYPNSLDTTYWIEYGTTSAYGQQTAPVDIGSGQAPVTVTPTLSGLAGSTTYHFRLVAQNSLGTTYGYDDALQTLGPGAPNNTVLPQISGTAQQTQMLTVSTGTWNPAGTTYSYQWQRDTGSGAQFITGATTSSYTLQTADVGASITVIVKATNANGTAQRSGRLRRPSRGTSSRRPSLASRSRARRCSSRRAPGTRPPPRTATSGSARPTED